MDPVIVEEKRACQRAAPQIIRDLQDMRLWRQALRPPAFLDPRHYGPADGLGARLAVVVSHVGGIKRSGVLTVTSASHDGVELSGEFPPVDYQFTFKISPDGPLASTLQARIVATPQVLFPYRIRTKLKLRGLQAKVQEIVPPLMNALEAALMAMPEDPAFHPRVTTDGFVEGPAPEEIPEGSGLSIVLLDKPIVLFAIDGALFAAADYPDTKGPRRGEGALKGSIFTDPRSQVAFDLRTGMSVDGETSIPTYPARLDGGKIYIRVQLV